MLAKYFNSAVGDGSALEQNKNEDDTYDEDCIVTNLDSLTIDDIKVASNEGDSDDDSDGDFDAAKALTESDASLALIVDFTAVWCGPCQRIAPDFARLAETHPKHLFVKVDVDELAGLAAELGVTSMPTFLFFRDGDLIHSIRGADEAALREQVAAHA